MMSSRKEEMEGGDGGQGLTPRQLTNLATFLDTRLLQLSRRFNKKFSADDGYTSFPQIASDAKPILEILEQSPIYIRIQYALTLTGSLFSYLPAFPPTAVLFPLSRRLDTLFVGLCGRVDSTSKVRIASVVNDARTIAVRVYNREWSIQAGMLFEDTIEELGKTALF